MKYNIFNGLLACGLVIAMAGCSENSWNEEYLDGFDKIGSGLAPKSEVIDYTLTAKDYQSIANNEENKAKAEADGVSEQLANVGKLGYFNDVITAEEYIGPWLNAVKASTSYPFYAVGNLSSVMFTYNQGQDMPAIVSQIDAAKIYTVTQSDYLQAWGGNGDAFVNAFTPAKPASVALPSLLKSVYPEAVSGDYVAVNYNQATTEPEFKPLEITPIRALELNTEVNVRGTVMGTCAQGYLIGDDTDVVFVYAKSDGGMKVGDYVTVKGTVGCYNGGLQLAEPTVVGANGAFEVSYPNPIVMDGATIDQYCADFIQARTDKIGLNPVYCQITGKVVVSGNNVNFIVDGAATGQGGAYGATQAIKDLCPADETVTVTGYLVQVASTKYCNCIITSVNGTPVCEIATPVAPKAEPAPIEATANVGLFSYNGSSWAPATGAYMLDHADYVALGQSYNNLSGTTPAEMLPLFLKQKFPFATADAVQYVAYLYYANKVTTVKCDQYVYDGTEWKLNSGYTEEQAQFVKTDGVFKFQPEQDPEINTLVKNQNYTLRGQLTALCNRGAVLTLSTGSLLVYDTAISWSVFAPGDRVRLSGGYTIYYGAPEMQNVSLSVTQAAAPLELPEPKVWTGADVDAWKAYVGENNSGTTTEVLAEYVEVSNVRVSINASGYYYLYTDDGSTYSLSFYQATSNQKAAFTDGETGVTVTGWAVSTGSSYVNFIPTKKNGVDIAPF